MLTSQTVVRIHDVSGQAALKGLEELADAGVLARHKLNQRHHAYVATELLDLLRTTERRLTSPRFDTRVSPPTRPVPAH